jgi:hypothetical protein
MNILSEYFGWKTTSPPPTPSPSESSVPETPVTDRTEPEVISHEGKDTHAKEEEDNLQPTIPNNFVASENIEKLNAEGVADAKIENDLKTEDAKTDMKKLEDDKITTNINLKEGLGDDFYFVAKADELEPVKVNFSEISNADIAKPTPAIPVEIKTPPKPSAQEKPKSPIPKTPPSPSSSTGKLPGLQIYKPKPVPIAEQLNFPESVKTAVYSDNETIDDVVGKTTDLYKKWVPKRPDGELASVELIKEFLPQFWMLKNTYQKWQEKIKARPDSQNLQKIVGLVSSDTRKLETALTFHITQSPK